MTDVGGGGCPPPEGNQTWVRKCGAGKVEVCNNNQQSLVSGGLTVRGLKSTTSSFGNTPHTGDW